MSRLHKILTQLKLKEKQEIVFTKSSSLSISNSDVIQFILDNKLNKITNVTKILNKDTINSGSSYIEFIAAKLKEKLHNDIVETKRIYKNLIEEKQITSFYEILEDSFIIDELTEIFCCRLVEINKNYLTPVTVFHSSPFLRIFQYMLVEYNEGDVDACYLRITTLEELIQMFGKIQSQYPDYEFMNYKNDDNVFLTTTASSFSKDKNLIENFYDNLKSKKEFDRFLLSNSDILIEDVGDSAPNRFLDKIKYHKMKISQNILNELQIASYIECDPPLFLNFRTFNRDGINLSYAEFKNDGNVYFFNNEDKLYIHNIKIGK